MQLKDVQDRLQEVDVEIKDGTLRRWATIHLITGPKRESKPGRQGAVWNWKKTSVEDAAAVWVIRRLKPDKFWSPPSLDTLKRIKLEANAISKKFRNDPESYKGVFRKQHDSKGDESSYMISYGIHPFIVSWITTVEKVKKRKSVHDPAKVIFDWNHHLIYENGVEYSELKFDGVKLESSDQNTVTQHVGYTPEVKEKLLAKMRTDVEKYGLKELSKEDFDEIERSAVRIKKQKVQKKERMLFRL